MSFIHIRKYREPDGTVKNYFDNPTFVDELYTQEFYDEGFPAYNEEQNAKDDFFKFRAGDFTIKFSLLQTVTSLQGGYNIKEFIKPQHDFNALFFVWVQLGNKNIFGILDLSSTLIDYTFIDGSYHIQADVYSLEKHFIDWCGAPIRIPPNLLPPPPDTAYTVLLTGFIQSYLFISKETTSAFVGNYFRLNGDALHTKWTERLGWYPVVIGECWNNLLDILELGGHELDPGFDYFYDLFQQLGFMYRFVMGDVQGNPEYFKVELKLFYRDQGITNWGELTGILKHREKVMLDAHKYVVMKFTHIISDSSSGYYGGLNPRYGGAVSAAGGYTFINDCELKPNKMGEPAVMVINAYSNQFFNYHENIYWEGWRTASISPAAIDDCKIVDPKDDHIFRISLHQFGKPYAYEYYFYNHAKKPDGTPHQLAVSIPRLCVKQYYFETLNSQSKIIHDTGSGDLRQLSIEQYPFLYIGDKTVKEFEIRFELGQAPQVGDIFTFQGYIYFINRISKFDSKNQTLTIDEAIEIGAVV